MPEPVPRPPKAPPDEPFGRLPKSNIIVPPDFFPPKPEEGPDISLPPMIRRPPMAPPRPIIDHVQG